MTREEVIDYLEFMQEQAHIKADSIVPCDEEIALGIAIEALKQPQAARCDDCPEKGTLERMEDLIRDFCYREYRDDKVDFANLCHVNILYSTDGEFEEHDVNVEVDLIHLKFRYMYDGEVVHTIRADDEEDMCRMLESLDFNDEYGIAVEWGRDEEEE